MTTHDAEPTLTLVLGRIGDVQRQIDVLHEDLIALQTIVTAFIAKPRPTITIERGPFPVYRARLWGLRLTLTPDAPAQESAL